MSDKKAIDAAVVRLLEGQTGLEKKGGENPPNASLVRPAAPQGSSGASAPASDSPKPPDRK